MFEELLHLFVVPSKDEYYFANQVLDLSEQENQELFFPP